MSSGDVTTPRAVQLVLEGCSLYWMETPLNSWQFSTQTFPNWRGREGRGGGSHQHTLAGRTLG